MPLSFGPLRRLLSPEGIGPFPEHDVNGLRTLAWMDTRRMVSCLVVTGLVIAAGCGPSRPATTTVTGTVTYSGKPVDGASVAFVPEKGAPVVGTTDAGGKFSIPGANLGPCRVTIAKASGGASAAAGGMPANPTPADMAKMAAAASAKKPEGPKSEIPEKYGRVISSGLSVTVGADATKNVFTFDLKD